MVGNDEVAQISAAFNTFIDKIGEVLLEVRASVDSMKSATGEDISIGWNWRATMMANSARDPYWQAGIRRETMDHPALSSAIAVGWSPAAL